MQMLSTTKKEIISKHCSYSFCEHNIALWNIPMSKYREICTPTKSIYFVKMSWSNTILNILSQFRFIMLYVIS